MRRWICLFLPTVLCLLVPPSVRAETWVDYSTTPVPFTVDEGSRVAAESNAAYLLPRSVSPFDVMTLDRSSGRYTPPDLPRFPGAGMTLCKADGETVYALAGNSSLFLRYSPHGDSWFALAPLPVTALDGAALAWAGGDRIYAISGNGVTFWIYDIATNSWTQGDSVPRPVGAGASLAWDGGDIIYATRGSVSGEVWEYRISTGRWNPPSFAPTTPAGAGSALCIVNRDLLFAFSGAGTIFWRYDRGANVWRSAAPAPAAVGAGASLVAAGHDTIYAFQGGATNGFWRYSVSADAWMVLHPAPATIVGGASLAYDGGGGVFASRGGGASSEFWRYDIASDRWSHGQSCPIGPSTQPTLARADAATYYAFPGGSTFFLKYSVAADSWTTVTPAPAAITTGCAMVAVGDTIYIFRGSTRDFWLYNRVTDQWTTGARTPATTGVGASLVHLGGDLIYATRGATTTEFWSYSISTNTWSVPATLPATPSNSPYLASNGSDTLFVLPGASNVLYYYNLSTDSWQTAAGAMPFTTGIGTSMVLVGNDTLYVARGTTDRQFRRYNVGSDNWTNLAQTPAPLSYGAMLAWLGGDTIYCIAGNANGQVWRYSIAQNRWSDPQWMSAAAGAGHAMVQAGSETFFVLQGTGNSFLRYSKSAQSWTSVASIPFAVTTGAFLCWDGAETIYAAPGAQRHFFEYSIRNNAWSVRESMPWGPGDGARMVHFGGDTFLAIRGGSLSDVTMYDRGQRRWYVGALPLVPNAGAAIVATANGDTLFLVGGNTTTTFYKYVQGRDTQANWAAAAPVPGAVGNGGAAVYGGGETLYVLRGNATDSFYAYRIATNAWTTLARAPGSAGSAGALAAIGSDTVYALGVTPSAVWRWRRSTNAWDTPASLPATVGNGAAMYYPGAGETIYILRGNTTPTLWAYRTAANTFETLAALPANVGAGGSLTGAAGTLYATFGANTTTAYRFTIATNSWAQIDSLPAAPNANGNLVTYDAVRGRVIGIRGITDAQAWEYDTLLNRWMTPAFPPATLGNGGGAVWVGGESVWVQRGTATATFYSFNHVRNAWGTMAPLPSTTTSGADLVMDSRANLLYSLRGGGQNLYRYDIGLNSWVTLESPPMAAGGTPGNHLAIDLLDSMLYATRGGTDGSVWRYDLARNRWFSLPATVVYGAGCVAGDTWYYIDGSTPAFRRWRASDDTWITLAPMPVLPGGGVSIAWNGADTIYAIRGGTTRDFLQYRISTDQWFFSESVPNTIGNVNTPGARLAYDSNANMLYCLRGYVDGSFWRYNPATNRWTVRAANVAMGSGGGLAAGNNSDSIFCVAGGAAASISAYSVGTDVWTALPNAPFSPTTNGSIATGGSGDTVYVLVNGNSRYLMAYDIRGAAWESRTLALIPETSGVAYNANRLVHDTESNRLIALAAGTYNTMYRYRIGEQTWDTPSFGPEFHPTGGVLATAAGETVYNLRGGNSLTFRSYVPSRDTWVSLASLPAGETVTTGAGMAWTGGETILVARGGSVAPRVLEYNIPRNQWSTGETLPAMPSVNEGARLVADTGTGRAWLLRGGTDSAFWHTDTMTRKWSLPNWTASVGAGGGSVCAGETLYVLAGNATQTFAGFNVIDRLWRSLGTAPATVGVGGSLERGEGDTLYALRGNATPSLYRYLIATNTWDTYLVAPGVVGSVNGKHLVFDTSSRRFLVARGVDSEVWRRDEVTGRWSLSNLTALPGAGACIAVAGESVYAIPGGATTFLGAIAGDSAWRTLAVLPGAAGLGAALTATGADTLYALRGGATANLYRYRRSSNAWATMTSCPSVIGPGGAIARSGADTLWVVRGGATTSFYSYNMISDAWKLRESVPTTCTGGASLLMPETQPYVYLLPGGSSRDLYRYNVAFDTWTAVDSSPFVVQPGSGATIETNGILVMGGGEVLLRRFIPTSRRPENVTATSPAGTANETVTPLFVFRATDPDSDPLHWRVQVALDAGFETIVRDYNSLSAAHRDTFVPRPPVSWRSETTSFRIPNADSLATYTWHYWRAIAFDGENTETSATKSFRTRPAGLVTIAATSPVTPHDTHRAAFTIVGELSGASAGDTVNAFVNGTLADTFFVLGTGETFAVNVTISGKRDSVTLRVVSGPNTGWDTLVAGLWTLGVHVSTPPDGLDTHAASFLVRGTCTDAREGDSVTILRNGIPLDTVALDSTLAFVGLCTVTAKSDSVAARATSFVGSVVADTRRVSLWFAPGLVISGIADGLDTNAASFRVRGTCTEAREGDSVTIFRNGIPLDTVALDSALAFAGQCTVTARSDSVVAQLVNLLGAVAWDTRRVSFWGTPTCTIATIPNGHDTHTASFLVRGTASEAREGDSVTIFRNGIPLDTVALDSALAFAGRCTVTAKSDSVTARLVNLLGDIATDAKRVSLWHAPACTLVVPVEGHDTFTTPLRVSGVASEAKEGDSVVISRNGIPQDTVALDSSLAFIGWCTIAAKSDSVVARLVNVVGDVAWDTRRVSYWPASTVGIATFANGHDTKVASFAVRGTATEARAGDSVTILRNGIQFDTVALDSGLAFVGWCTIAAKSDSVVARLSRFLGDVYADTKRVSLFFAPTASITNVPNDHETRASTFLLRGAVTEARAGDSVVISRNGVPQDTVMVTAAWSFAGWCTVSARSDSVVARLVNFFGDVASDTRRVSYDTTFPGTVTLDRATYQKTRLVVITVQDLDQDLDMNQPDSLTVTVRCLRTGDAESVVLTETANASGAFSNAGLRLSDTTGASANDGILLVGTDDTFLVTYIDPTDASDSASAAGTFVRTVSQGTVRIASGAVRDGDSILVRVDDIDRNMNPLLAETMILRNAFSMTPDSAILENEFQTIRLTETTETSGVFVSGPLRFSSFAPVVAGDSILLVARGGSITLEYLDSLNGDFATAETSVLWFTTRSAARLDRPVYSSGLPAYPEVTDTDRNRSATQKDTVRVVVANAATGETEIRILWETAERSGLFRDTGGLLLTNDALDSLAANGRLYVRTGDSIVVSYTDEHDATDSSTDSAGVGTNTETTWSIVAFTSASGTAVASYRMDSLVFVTLVDTDQNIGGTLIETASVRVYCPATGDSETILLGEITPDTGVFRNATGLALSDTTGAAVGDGILFAGAVFDIRVHYTDPARPADSSTAAATLSARTSPSSLAFERAMWSPESGVTVILRDPSLNRNPLVADTAWVTVTSISAADTETILMTETSAASGIFTNATPLRVADTQGFAAGDGILLVALGDTIRAVYQDAYDAGDSSFGSAVVARLATAATIVLDSTGYRAVDTVTVSVMDRDRNLDPRRRDTLQVSLRNPRTGDSETVTLTETDSASWIFRLAARLLSESAPATPGDGVLQVVANDTVVFECRDATNGDTVETSVRVAVTPTQAAVAVSNAAPRRNDTFTVTVTDADRNTNSNLVESIGLYRIEVYDPDSAVVENELNTFLLVETTESSGIFRTAAALTVSDTESPAVTGNATLSAGPGFVIRVEYRDPHQGDMASLSLTTADSASPCSGSFDASSYRFGESVHVTIRDRNMNRRPLRRDTVAVTVRNEATGETEMRILRETGTASFAFTDDTGLLLSAWPVDSAPNDGRLYVRESDTIRFDYTDPYFPSDTVAASALVTAVPPSAGTVRWTAASGAPAASFRPGDSLFVLLVDTDRNRNPTVVETVVVLLKAVRSSDRETVVLSEASADSVRFVSQGVRLSDTQGTAVNDGILAAGYGDSILVLYAVDSSADTALVEDRPSSCSVSFDVSSYALDSRPVVTVSDRDQNLDPYAVDTITVTFTTRLGADTETAVLSETTETSGVFTGAGPRLSDTTGAAAGDGTLLAGALDSILVQYADPAGTPDSAAAQAATLRRSTRSNLVLGADSYPPTATAAVLLGDTDRNRNPRLRETLVVTITSAVSGDSESVTLTESTETSALFTGTITLTRGGAAIPGDSSLLVQPGDTISASYVDAHDPADTSAAQAAVGSESTAASLSLDRALHRAADSLVFTVRDADRNIRALVIDTLVVVVAASRTGDRETVTLTETAAASGAFRNEGLRLSDTDGAGAGDGVLLIGAGETFTVVYVDPADATDSARATGLYAATAVPATVEFSRVSYNPGETAAVTVRDASRNADPLRRDTVTVILVNAVRSDTETLHLTESSETSCVFAADTPPGFEAVAIGVPGDGRIQALLGDVFEARYLDPHDATDSAVDTATLARPSIHHVDARPEHFADTVRIRVSFRGAAGETIAAMEGFRPVEILSMTGGTGSFISTSETVTAGVANFTYSKRENAVLEILFRVSNETWPVPVPISAPGSEVVNIVFGERAFGSAGGLSMPASLFPADAVFIVENRARLADSPVLVTLIDLAGRELDRAGIGTPLSIASGGSVRAEHRFRILVGGVEQTNLPGVVSVILTYPDADSDGIVDGTNLQERNLRVYRLDEANARYIEEPDITIDAVRNRVTVRVSHFTLFVLAGGASVSNLNALVVYPNPFRPNSGLGHIRVNFDNLPSGAKLRIFTSDGRRVSEGIVPGGSNALSWDGRNDAGRVVASGVYVYVAEFAGQRIVGKVVVAR